MTLGVGIIGCGAAAQAIHLPAIASLPSELRIVHCMDVDPATGAEVARRVGGASTTDLQTLLDDPAVDVVAVCGPSGLHADHVEAACYARKRAVFCEKPLADTAADAHRIVEAADATGVPVIVGNMHRYDPALRALESRWGDLPSRAMVMRSTMFLAPNANMVRAATEPSLELAGWPPGTPARDVPSEFARQTFAGLMLGLAIHHIPLVRMAMPEPEQVDVALPLGTNGYLVKLSAGPRSAVLESVLHTYARTDWSFELWASDLQVRVDYPAGYVPSQTAQARLWSGTDGTLRVDELSRPETGYRAEWRHVAAVARGEEVPLRDVREAAADVALALRITEAVTA